MTRAIPILVALVATGVRADPAAPPPAVDPVEVVGRYTARLKWSGCSVRGERTPVVELRSVDRRLELDLAAVQPGLGVVAIDGDARRLAGTSADLTVSLARGKRGSIVIAIYLDSGCRARGTIRRDTSGIAGCDRLVALARIEAGCTAIAAPDRATDVAALDAERPAWLRLGGARKRDAEQACTVRAAALESTLIDAACVEVPAGAAPIPVAECRDLAILIARLSRCRTLPDDHRAQLRAALVQIATTVEPAERDQLDPARLFCSDMTQQLQEIQQRFGC